MSHSRGCSIPTRFSRQRRTHVPRWLVIVSLVIAASDGRGLVADDSWSGRDVAVEWRRETPPARPPAGAALRVVQGRSQVIPLPPVMLHPAVSDAAVAEVLRSRDGALILVGLQTGTTELSLWSTGDDRPLVYPVHVLPDPLAPSVGHLDAVALERRLAEMFPASRVSLVPLSREILVKGSAASAEEAASILAAVRRHVARAAAGTRPGIQLVSGGTDDRVRPSSLMVKDQLAVPSEEVVHVRVTAIELDRHRLTDLQVDLQQLLTTSDTSADAHIRSRTFALPEIGVLQDWLREQNAGRMTSDAVVKVLSGRPIYYVPSGRTPRSADPQSATIDRSELALTLTARVGQPSPHSLQVRLTHEQPQPPASDADLGMLTRSAGQWEAHADLNHGQALALVVSYAAPHETVLRVPLVGDLAPVRNAPGVHADPGDLLIIIQLDSCVLAE